jgi:hypothetical protein
MIQRLTDPSALELALPQPQREQTVAREVRDRRERRDPKFEVLGSKFRKPRTSNLEPSSVSLVPPVSRGIFQHPATALLPEQSLCKDDFGSSTDVREDPTRKEQSYAAKD